MESKTCRGKCGIGSLSAENADQCGNCGACRKIREKYDAFLEELVDKGALTNDEIMYLGYKGAIYSPAEVDSWVYKCDENRILLEDAYGNSMDWTKTMSLYVLITSAIK